jgi:hypothetical protein
VDNQQFWAVANSAAFRRRFRGEHPLLPDNGGVEFYNSECLAAGVADLEQRLRAATDPKNRYLLTNFLATRRSWLRQTQWVEEHPLYEVE